LQAPVISESGIPRKLLPSCEVATRLKVQEKPLGRLTPCPDRKEYFKRAAERLTGDIFGLRFPANPEEFVSSQFGPMWLTEAFHKAGTLAEDNAVKRITWWRRFPGGGSGPKTLFTVEYEKPDDSLDTVLFMKQPYTLEENKNQRFIEEGQCVFGDVHGGEINFYQWISPHVPFPVPRYYFGDMNRRSSESCLINAAMDWPSPDKTEFGPYEVLPPCEKCEDWRLKDSHEYYFALMKRLGAIAGLEKVGKLGDGIKKVEWHPYYPDQRKHEPGMAKLFRQFVKDVAPQIWPTKVKTKTFLDRLEQRMDRLSQGAVAANNYMYSDPLYIGLGHANGNTDNAYFWRNAAGEMECGLFDWGQTGWMSFASMFNNSLTSCLGEVIAEYDDRFIQTFVDTYHETGAPQVDVDEVLMRWRLSKAVVVESQLAMVLPFLSEKHPQGRPFWKDVQSYRDDKIISNFGLKFGVSMLYNGIVLWSLRGDTYWESVEAWAKKMGFD